MILSLRSHRSRNSFSIWASAPATLTAWTAVNSSPISPVTRWVAWRLARR